MTIESTRAAYEAAIRADERARILATLNGTAANEPTPRKWQTRNEPRKGQKRNAKDIAATVTNLQRAIATAPGSGIEYLGKQMGVPTKDLALPVKKLLAAKRIKTTGHKRATRYFPRSS